MPALIGLAYLSLLVLGLLDNVRGPFYPDILEDLNLSATRGSLFFAVTSMLAFCGSWSSQILLRRYSSVTLVLVSCFGFGLGFGAIAISDGVPWMLLACAFFGWALGVLAVAQNVLVVEHSQGELRRRLLTGLHGMYAVASLGAPLLATVLRSQGLGWREAFLLFALAPVVLASVSWLYLRVRAEGRLQSRQNSAFTPRAVDHQTQPLTAGEWMQCILFGLLMAGYLWGEVSVFTRFVLWLRLDHGYVSERADLMLAAFFLALLMGRLAFGVWNLRGLSNWMVLALSSGLAGFLYLAGLHWNPWLIVAAGLFMAPFYPVALDQIQSLFGPKGPQAMGFVIGFGSFSLVLMHITLGRLNDWWGITKALQTCALAQLGVALVLILRLVYVSQVRVLARSAEPKKWASET
ncbi:MAG: sugar MFS transporter [Bdellovibrionales bacterium]